MPGACIDSLQKEFLVHPFISKNMRKPIGRHQKKNGKAFNYMYIYIYIFQNNNIKTSKYISSVFGDLRPILPLGIPLDRQLAPSTKRNLPMPGFESGPQRVSKIRK